MDYLAQFQLEEFSPAVSPMCVKADMQSLYWAKGCRLVRTAESERRMAATHPGLLAANCYPGASLLDLCLAADWMVWLFAFDDQLDEGSGGRRPGTLERAIADVRTCLEYGGAADPTGSFGVALSDIWRRARGRVSEEWEHRFRHHMFDYFRACIWQSAHRRTGVVPDLATFPQMRRDAGAIMPSFDFIELVEGSALPTELYYSAAYQRLLITAANVVCWTNDVMTLEKEMARGDNQNLVLVVSQAERIEVAHAVEEVIRQIRQELLRFRETEDADLLRVLDELGANDECRAMVTRCVAMLKAWMGGHVAWGQATARYLEVDRSVGPPVYLEDLLGS